jgi:hypothetical protein
MGYSQRDCRTKQTRTVLEGLERIAKAILLSLALSAIDYPCVVDVVARLTSETIMASSPVHQDLEKKKVV